MPKVVNPIWHISDQFQLLGNVPNWVKRRDNVVWGLEGISRISAISGIGPRVVHERTWPILCP